MAKANAVHDDGAFADHPAIRKIEIADLKEVLAKGLDDFNAKPSHILLLVVIYPVVGLIAARVAAGYDLLPLVFPLVSGFALVGPVAAIGLYELSRRREKGLDLAWRHAFDVWHSHSIRAIITLGIALAVIFVAWIGAAQAIYKGIFGRMVPISVVDFATKVLTTPDGWTLIVVGCGVGFLFAVAVLTMSVVSFPLLLDRNVGATIAVVTSIRAVAANPKAMAAWGLIVAVSLFVGSIPFFVGLAVVMPVLGHATWHLYRKVVEP